MGGFLSFPQQSRSFLTKTRHPKFKIHHNKHIDGVLKCKNDNKDETPGSTEICMLSYCINTKQRVRLNRADRREANIRQNNKTNITNV